jgi:hypothetical protein
VDEGASVASLVQRAFCIGLVRHDCENAGGDIPWKKLSQAVESRPRMFNISISCQRLSWGKRVAQPTFSHK